MVSIKERYEKYKQEKEIKKQRENELKQELSAADEELRRQAREQAQAEYLEKRPEAFAKRKEAFLEQERKQYEETLARAADTRTPGQKFKEGMQKIGEKAQGLGQRIGGDTAEWVGQANTPNVSNFDREVGGKLFFGRYPEMQYGAERMQGRAVDMKDKLRPNQLTEKSIKVKGKIKAPINYNPQDQYVSPGQPFQLNQPGGFSGIGSWGGMNPADKVRQMTGQKQEIRNPLQRNDKIGFFTGNSNPFDQDKLKRFIR